MGSRSDPMILVAEPHHANLRHRFAQQELQAVRSSATGASGTDSMDVKYLLRWLQVLQKKPKIKQ
ncbi:hypothetical protein DAPPUDRAFT_251639 [Daphnia pulex]|uniref:Uncharacterized protein n=1 Tax=Daphnia pulex TaxID=6669 RepID=E9H0U1_DAPPU|nr:hypothetical protein DAPPUDRAFT_251639 [Daphnia pulex]|eukprot:EFX74516.1 hypothetical protein DAPPUDRAFT_251639 [Daphnia pulex]